MAKWWTGLAVCVALAAGGCGVEEVAGTLGVARVGDPCKDFGKYACDREGEVERELICAEGAFEVSQECPGGCTLEEQDGKTLLECLGEDGLPK
jgi:hypothetical protein